MSHIHVVWNVQNVINIGQKLLGHLTSVFQPELHFFLISLIYSLAKPAATGSLSLRQIKLILV